MRSPGTSEADATFAATPPRTTRAFGDANFRSIWSERSARYSWRNPTHAFNTTIARITPKSIHSRSRIVRIAATSSTPTTGERICPFRIANREGPSSSAIRLGPRRSRRARASASEMPLVGSVWRAAATSATVSS
jgi:hypothetical protein